MKVLVVGSGMLGMRHIQGCLRASETHEVYAIDKDYAALANMRSVVSADPLCDTKKLRLATDYTKMPSQFDVCIVATSAHGRAALLTFLVNHLSIRYWIVEKLLEQSKDELAKIESDMRNQICWVNTPRRTKKLYNIIPKIETESSFRATVTGKIWGIASNAIHYIDYVEFITDRRAIDIDVSDLDRDWYETKRSGYFDVSGELSILFENDGILRLCSYPNLEGLAFSIQSQNISSEIDEANGLCRINDSSVEIANDLQSDMTPKLIKDLVSQGRCCLPTLATSIRQHKLLIAALSDHKFLNGSEQQKLEIT